MNSCSRYLLAVWLLPRALAFIPPVGLVSSATGRSSFRNNVLGHVDVMCKSRAPTLTVMAASASSTESAVDIYKNFLGANRWKEFGEPTEEAALTYNEICDVYGEENAIKMVKSVPNCLAYNRETLRETFEAFCENFPPEDTKAMVTRNPNLMAIRPRGFGGACNAKQDTMTMSYVIAFTRPLGPILLGGLFLLIATPFIERFTGLQIAALLPSFGN